MNNMFKTRAEYAGVKPKVLRARTEKAIAEIEKRINDLAKPYEDVDNSVVGAAAQLASAFDEFKQRILDTQAYLEEAQP